MHSTINSPLIISFNLQEILLLFHISQQTIGIYLVTQEIDYFYFTPSNILNSELIKIQNKFSCYQDFLTGLSTDTVGRLWCLAASLPNLLAVQIVVSFA